MFLLHMLYGQMNRHIDSYDYMHTYMFFIQCTEVCVACMETTT